MVPPAKKKDCRQPTARVAGAAMLLISIGAELFGQTRATEIPVEASFAGKRVATTENIELRLKQPLRESESRLAILIGTTDVSSLFTRDGLRLRYNAKLWPLPAGKTLVRVYLVSKNDNWAELARFPLLVGNSETHQTRSETDWNGESPAGRRSGPAAPFFDNPASPVADQQATAAAQAPAANGKPPDDNAKWKLTPSLTLAIPAQPAQATFPGPRPEHATFTEINLQASMKSEISHGIFTAQSTIEFAGSSFQEEALRFATLGAQAPKVDMAGYQVHVEIGKVKVDVGHFSYGTQRQLIQGFSSRGLQITVPFLQRFDFTAAAMNGTQLVGYDNFLGLDNRRHRLLSGTLGIELIRKRPGGLRVEVSALNAYFQPLGGVNRGVVTDLQRSNGMAARLIASDPSQRLRFEGGFTRSLFGSTNDTTLSQGASIVALPSLTRDAHYLEASCDLLRNYALTETKKVNLSVAFREEKVAPLFRSLGAATQADKVQYEFSANGSINEITAQFSQVNFHDNLRRIPSILRSLTGSTHLGLAAPASALLNRENPSPWLPRLGYSFDRLHALGDAIPVNGGFELDLSAVPDLFGTNQTFSADWQVKQFTWGYSVNRSFQDSRQKGREHADLGVVVNTGRVGIAATSRLTVNMDLGAESAVNKESHRLDRTFRLGPGVTWQLTNRLGMSVNLANTIAGDAAKTGHSRNTEFDASWTYRFERGRAGLRRVAGQFFIRYANSYSRSLDRLLFADSLRKNQTLTANLGMTFF